MKRQAQSAIDREKMSAQSKRKVAKCAKASFPEPESIRPPVFSAREGAEEIKEAMKHLESQGYAVISLGSPEERAEIGMKGRDLAWEHLSLVNPAIRRDLPETWANYNWPGTFKDGVMSGNAAGQSELQWFARTIPDVKVAFKSAWRSRDRNCDELAAEAHGGIDLLGMLVSYDGFGAMRPVKSPDGKSSWATKGSWYHVDQTTPGFQCVQGLVNLVPCLNPRYSPGFVCVPRSHLDDVYEDVFRRDPGIERGKREWVFLDVEKHVRNPREHRPQRLMLDEGELLMWDSRLIHCNDPGAHPSEDPTSGELRRLTSYVCMVPTAKAGDSYGRLLEKRIEGYRDGATTNHWPHKYVENKVAHRWKAPNGRRASEFYRPQGFTDERLRLVRGE